MKFNKDLLEYYGVDPARVPDFEEYWALYATSFYERLFSKINDPEELKRVYLRYINNPKLDKRGKMALTFFYNLRRDEMEDPNYWDKVGRGSFEDINKNESKLPMKAKLVKESLNEYYSDDEKLKAAKEEARRISREEGVVQHVNEIRPGVYRVEDWYDADTTVASYENGRSLDESLNEAWDNYYHILSQGGYINKEYEMEILDELKKTLSEEEALDAMSLPGVKTLIVRSWSMADEDPKVVAKWVLDNFNNEYSPVEPEDEMYESGQDYSPGLIGDFNDLAAELEKRRVPCKLQLVDAWGRYEFHILCGWDYPDRIADKAFDAIEASEVNAEVMADQSGGEIIKSKMIAGGPKRYSRW
jgi:hypothetical protein